jgi:serine/threonine protein kinase
MMKVLDSRYELRGLLKEYPYGKLWLAQDTELSRQVFIREIYARSYQSDAAVRELVRTYQNVAQLKTPNVEHVVIVRKDKRQNIYIISSYVKAITLQKLIAVMPNMNVAPELLLYILGRAASGLATAHSAREHLSNKPINLYHLGLSPERILLTESGEVQVVDFALPIAATGRSAEETAYLAPEQVEGTSLTPGTDVFSLGVVGFELFAGRRLFPQQSASELMAVILKGSYKLDILRTSVSPEIFAIIDQCLRRNKSDRFRSAVMVADKINALLSGRLTAPDKKIAEYVEKLFETPKLVAAVDTQREAVKTEVFGPGEVKGASSGMTNSSQDGKGKKKPRPGEETVIRSIPVGERFKRMQPGDSGGRKLLVILSVLAGVLAVGLIVVFAVKLLSNRQPAPITEMETGTITTVPDSAAVYLADSLLGTTPGTFTLKPDEMIKIEHPCCGDTIVPVDFEKFAEGPIYLEALIEITSIPEGADITINGDKVDATTPYTLHIRPDQNLQVKLQLSGRPDLDFGEVAVANLPEYQSDAFDISLLPGGGYRLVGAFGKKPESTPQVLIASAPTGAEVKMDGQVIGTTPLRRRFDQGSVKLILTKNGYEDRVVNLPTGSSRKSKYDFLLFRRVYVTAYKEGEIDNTVTCRVRDVIYGNRSHSVSETTPAYLRLPGVECRVILAADGYYDTDTLVGPAQKDLTAIMRPKTAEKGTSVAEKQVKQEPAETSKANKAEVRIFVTDKKNVPVEGAAITAEKKTDSGTELLELGNTDQDGKLVLYLDPAKYKFIAKHIDYKLGDESKEVKAGQTYVLTIEVKRR